MSPHLEVTAQLKKYPIPPKYAKLMEQFYLSYLDVYLQYGEDVDLVYRLFDTYTRLVHEQIKQPYAFAPYHVTIRAPFDYYQFGIDLFEPIIDLQASFILHSEEINQMEAKRANGDNIILLANHQTEVDPQAMSLLLRDRHPKMAEEMIFVAGERVLTDPMAVPLSMGRNLLCIYSKKHMGSDKSRLQKLTHNRRTMKKMASLLSEGGQVIYVAPSGGRDRPDASGHVPVASFDPQSVEMFRLMTSLSKRTCHFQPLAVSTYSILPPPDRLGKELGEARFTCGGGAYLAFGSPLNFDRIVQKTVNKRHRREVLAQTSWRAVSRLYQQLPQQHAKPEPKAKK